MISADVRRSIKVDLHIKTNNTEHRTSEISEDELIVRRGQPFTLSLNLTQPFNPDLYPLTITALTGEHPAEHLGTLSYMSIPDGVQRSPSAKAVWKMELHKNSSPLLGNLTLSITPPADAPIGDYRLSMKHQNEEALLATLSVLFNPWCPDDWVFLPDEVERQEYVMNEQGIIYKGSGNYISPMIWDFGQFEKNMVKICMKILDKNRKHLIDPVDDVSARCNPIYVSRVVSAMINSQDDSGVLVGRWSGSFWDGFLPTHWSGSHAILERWFNRFCQPVKYGQCWVFAGVMCSVMRLLGIPCRVITNFQSAHDSNQNLIIDVYHADYGVRERPSTDSIWNYHVWVEAWMRRPDLTKDGKYDGWQVLDPTPQEKSNGYMIKGFVPSDVSCAPDEKGSSSGMYCCGPASVKAILNGETHLKYDVPFVYAEVNADCVDWLVKADGSKVNILSDTKRVGHSISTKSVGSNKRMDITDSYKQREGSEMERAVFKYAKMRLHNGGESEETETSGSISPLPRVSMRFDEVSKPMNGKDVHLNLVLHSESKVARLLSVNITVQGTRYNGSPVVSIQTEMKQETLQPGRDLSIPILIPFSVYRQHMHEYDSMKVSAIVTDINSPDNTYLAEDDVVLLDPPVSITVIGQARLNSEVNGQLVFQNPVNEMLKDCTLTISGSGLLREEIQCRLPDMKPNIQIRANFFFVPYKIGQKTLVVNIDCSTFRNIKSSYTVNVLP